MIEVGLPAPDFILMDTEKKKHSLSDYLGKKAVLAFFPGAFTGGCTKELCTLRDSMSEFNSMDVNVLAISVDSIFANKAFRDQNKLSFPLLSDFKKEVIEKYGVVFVGLGGMEGYVSAQRAVFFVDGDGRISYKWIADSPGVEPFYADLKKALAYV